MAVSIDDIKKLKNMTGVGLTDAKKALEEADGDFDKALETMRVKGLARADKKADRAATAGIIHSYVHSEKIGVLVELNCETDFVARTDDFKSLANDIAMHIAASSPLYLSESDIPEQELAKEKELVMSELAEAGKPQEMRDQIAEGKLSKWYEEVCLMQQQYVKDPEMTVADVVKSGIATLGENIQIGQFSRIELGDRS